jgi:hypothetical protein
MKGEMDRGIGYKRRRWDSNPRGLFTLHDFQSCSLGHYETPPDGRREWDSNPRGLFTLPLFESGTFDHSDISPSRSIAYFAIADNSRATSKTQTLKTIVRTNLPQQTRAYPPPRRDVAAPLAGAEGLTPAEGDRNLKKIARVDKVIPLLR